jgi:hypothetical protein
MRARFGHRFQKIQSLQTSFAQSARALLRWQQVLRGFPRGQTCLRKALNTSQRLWQVLSLAQINKWKRTRHATKRFTILTLTRTKGIKQ